MESWKPILLDFPSSFETERLVIRQPLPGDGKLVYEAKMESLRELQQWMPWADDQTSEEETEVNIRQAYIQFLERSDLRFHLFERESMQFIGSSGLHRIDWQIRKFEIGYWCRTRFTGKGYITEAVKGITVFAFQFLEANRVEIRCDEKNTRSRKVAERVGYQLEGILRNHEFSVDGHLRNTCIYAMTPEDFQLASMRSHDK